MDNLNFNNISQNESYNKSNGTIENDEGDKDVKFIMHVATCIIITIGLPLILVAIYSLYSLVQNNNVAPIYVINLFISDLIQLCCMIVWESQDQNSEKITNISRCIHFFGLMASVGFMVCIALERYLVIACPLWYRFRRTIKISVLVCAFVWAVPLVPLLIYYWKFVDYRIINIVLYLLPFPLFIFFLGGTLKALSASKSVPFDEKQRIVAILVLVLFIYVVLFTPNTIFYMFGVFGVSDKSFDNLSLMFIKLSPLADSVLYIFMRKGAIDKLLTSLCCCRMDNNDNNSLESVSVSMMTTCTLSASEREGEKKQNGRKQENVNK